MVLVWKRRGPLLFLLEFRSEPKESLDFSDGGIETTFFPWCGANLNKQRDKQRPKDDFEEYFPDEAGMLFGSSCAMPVWYGRAEGPDA